VGRYEQTLPIFPLGNVALFPHVRAPFRIFEPRYRQLTEHILAGDGRLVMATVRPDHADQMAGDPPVFPIACAAVIRNSQRLPDGRFHLLLLGTHRVRMLEEPPRPAGRLFRVARVESLDDACEPTEAPHLAALRSQALALVRELMPSREATNGGNEPAAESFHNLDDAAFVNALCSSLPFPALEKQGLLEADGIARRFERLIDILSFSLASGETRRVPNSGTFH
jgi:Lon protease-like protein